MKNFLKAAFEVTLLILVLGLTLAGYYWVMTRYFAMTKEGAILILAPTALIAVLTAIYGYYLGWHRYQTRDRPRPATPAEGMVTLMALAVLVLGQAGLAIYFLQNDNVGVALLFFVTACGTALWSLRRRWSELGGVLRDAQSEGDADWMVFERRFRVFVFGLLIILPVGLSLFSFVGLGDIPEGVLFAIIAAVIAPWVLRKIRAEMRNR